MLKRDGWQALQEAREGAMPRQLELALHVSQRPPQERGNDGG